MVSSCTLTTRDELIAYWETGSQRLVDSLGALTSDALGKTVTIRDEPHSVPLALERSLAHTAYYVVQIM
jgi:hypothetical protein